MRWIGFLAAALAAAATSGARATYFDGETGMAYNYFRTLRPDSGRYIQPDPIGLQGGSNRFAYVGASPLMYTDPLGLMGGSGSGAGQRNGGPIVSAFGCMGLACATGSTQDAGAQFSAELTLGGGVEVCDPAPPAPEPSSCSRYDPAVQVQPPGVPLPQGGASALTMRGGLFFGPSWKKDGRFCLRMGPHYSIPGLPSVDLGGAPVR